MIKIEIAGEPFIELDLADKKTSVILIQKMKLLTFENRLMVLKELNSKLTDKIGLRVVNKVAKYYEAESIIVNKIK